MKIKSSHKLLLFLGLSFIIRICIAYSLELGNDEVYYIKYIQFPNWSYFDHPLMVGLMGFITTLRYTLTAEIFIRLGSVLIGTINSYLIYKIALYLWNEKTAWVSLILYSASIYDFVIVGIFFMPDAPLTLFWLLCLWYGLHCIKEKKINYIFLFAFFLALAIASKYQALFLGLGMFLFILFKRKYWLTSYKIYLAGAIALLGFIPTFIWNLQHHWISFAFHKNRIGKEGFDITYFFREVFGEIFYNNPFSFLLYIMSLLFIFKTKKYKEDVFLFLLLISLPLIFISISLSFFTETFPHWTGPCYFSFILIGSYYIILDNKWKKVPNIALFLLLFIVSFGYIEIQNGFIMNAKSLKQPIEKKGKHDFTQDTYGWKQLGEKFSDIKKKHFEIAVILSPKWYPASHLDYYVASPNHLQLICEGSLQNIHTYAWTNSNIPWQKAYYITSSNHFYDPKVVYPQYISYPTDTIAILRRQDTIRLHFIHILEKK